MQFRHKHSLRRRRPPRSRRHSRHTSLINGNTNAKKGKSTGGQPDRPSTQHGSLDAEREQQAHHGRSSPSTGHRRLLRREEEGDDLTQDAGLNAKPPGRSGQLLGPPGSPGEELSDAAYEQIASDLYDLVEEDKMVAVLGGFAMTTNLSAYYLHPAESVSVEGKSRHDRQCSTELNSETKAEVVQVQDDHDYENLARPVKAVSPLALKSDVRGIRNEAPSSDHPNYYLHPVWKSKKKGQVDNQLSSSAGDLEISDTSGRQPYVAIGLTDLTRGSAETEMPLRSELPLEYLHPVPSRHKAKHRCQPKNVRP